MNVGGTQQFTNNLWFSISKMNKCKYNVSDTKNHPEDSIHRPPRFADEFIKLSSVRYKPEKNYTKHCPDGKAICERTQISSFSPCPFIDNGNQFTR